MPRRIWISLLTLAAGFVFVTGVSGAIIVDQTITGSAINTFDGIGTGNADGLLAQSGAQYGERFSGQVLSTSGDFDVLTATPSSPLTLLSGEAGLNLLLALIDTSVLLTGCGPAICPNFNAGGEGAVSILLDSPTDVFGFNVVGTEGGTANVAFFGASGALLASFALDNLTDSFFGFRDTSGSTIAGVSVTNNDPGGIGFDNVTFNIGLGQPIPEPAGLALLAIGLAGLHFSRRR